MASPSVCELSADLKAALKKFRFRKGETFAALVMKIDPEKLLVVEDEIYEDISFEDFVSELPDHSPRYVVISFRKAHQNGRVSYPLCFIFVSPQGAKTELQIMYAGSKTGVVNELGLTKVFEVRDVEELTEEWINSKLDLISNH
ncbi:glia maturation factor beta [Hydra vulgaris]|uniref:glia maturation factor beta n=1 Tax=Hydra vulgaris TaxID=6087 RepID=UPI001F5F6F3E|nr:glia maturation factor beta [Hydra vulgaris]